VGDQAWGIGVGQGRRRDRVVELPDLRVEPDEQLEAVIATLRGVRGERESLQLRQTGPAEQLGATGEAVVESDGVQAILDHGADADEAHPVGEERAQIARRGIRHPDRGEAIVSQQVEDVQRVAAIGLGLAHDHRANLRGLADEQRVPEARHERVKPDGVAGALNPDRHRPRQRGIEFFARPAVVDQLVLAHLSRAGIQHGHLLRARMQVASHECHGVGLLSESAVAQGEHSNSARPSS
jgi:hypothetical protein